jgi:hypothetical protein
VRSSDSRDEHLMLDRDLPTTAADMVALQRTCAARRMPLAEYLAFLARLGSPEHARLRSRRGPAGPPFRLAPMIALIGLFLA